MGGRGICDPIGTSHNQKKEKESWKERVIELVKERHWTVGKAWREQEREKDNEQAAHAVATAPNLL